MKKHGMYLSILGCLLTLTACSNSPETDSQAQQDLLEEIKPSSTYTNTFGTTPAKSEATLPSVEGIDIDLTQLSSTMVYSEVYQMMFYPSDYEGKTIRMSGEFFVYVHPDTGQHYFTVVVADALACCQQGLEFVLKEGTYPQDYPQVGDYVTVIGEFQTYMEYDYTYFQLVDAELM